ncbi:MAG: peptide chain release factor-like protein [Planctomycetota bacterium]|nr:peptide chain release factor-like protein [Planctomycetota bacterium]MCX8039771.1 peptide chain release factor-like protein [Planctomycetota bacterium]MDW8373151.1 peptide chain release factor-like protein [Planctomycetota bacterium]
MHPAVLSDAELLADCTRQALRCGGPGGQHAQRTASGVRLVHAASGLVVEADEHREAAANLRAALQRLRLLLACRLRGGSDPAWIRDLIVDGRLRCRPGAARWPAVAAVLLDALAAADGDHRAAAQRLGLSPTQLVRALCADPAVRRAADALRRGRPPLRP